MPTRPVAAAVAVAPAGITRPAFACSAMRDVAGMFRSFAYAAAVAGVSQDIAARWSALFLEGWREVMPLPSGEWRTLLDTLIWEKAIYEAEYELRHRPDWLWIPLSVFSEKF